MDNYQEDRSIRGGVGGHSLPSQPRGHDPSRPALSQDAICTEHQSRHAHGLMQLRGPGQVLRGLHAAASPLCSVPHLHTRTSGFVS